MTGDLVTIEVRAREVRRGDLLHVGLHHTERVPEAWSSDDGTGYVRFEGWYVTVVLDAFIRYTVERPGA